MNRRAFPQGNVASLHLEGLLYRNLRQFVFYWKRRNLHVVVPAGFDFDKASIPKIVPRWVLERDGDMDNAALPHDFLYGLEEIHITELPNEMCRIKSLRGHRWVKSEVDLMFYDAMVAAGLPKWKAWIAYAGVRANLLRAWKWSIK